MSRTISIGALLLVAMACTAPNARRGQDTAVVLPAVTTAADQQQATTEFERWLETNLRTPGSVFRLTQAGHDRLSVSTRFVASVPLSWGAPSAVSNRAAFIVRQRKLFQAAIGGPNTVSVPAPVSASGTPRIVIVPALDSRGLQWTWRAAERPSHAATVCDVSPSDVGIACTPLSLLFSYDAWLPSALGVGSTFRVWIVGTTISTAACTWAVQVPELPLADRLAYLMSARNELADIFDRLPPHTGSAVAEAITVAVGDLATRPGAKSLQVLSDLRENSGPFAFDRQLPTAGAFCRWLAAEHLLPDCRNIAVRICGVHFRAAPRHAPFDARNDARLRTVWTQALASMHAAVVICSECDAEAFMNLGGESNGTTN